MSFPWLPKELNFITEEETRITIIPNFSYGSIHLISGTYGPFVPAQPVKVPMWLALFLSSSQICQLKPPKWLNKSTLKRVVEKEKESTSLLTKLPSHYMEIGITLLYRAESIIPEADQVRTLMEDIWDLRFEKLRRSVIDACSETLDQTQLPNVTQMELHLFRESITKLSTLLTSMNENIVPVENID